MNSPKVFLSYSRRDSRWKDLVVTHLGVLSKQNILDLWDDQRIAAGEDWYSHIQKALNSADAAILLISANSLTSDFILREEIKRLLERRQHEGLPIFPIVVSPCDWEAVDWLRKMQLRPSNGKPLSAGNRHQIDARLSDIAKEIRSLLISPELFGLNNKSLLERFHTLKIEVDTKINNLLPEKLISPTKNYSLQPFSSEKLLTSLSQLGIPLEAGLEVLQHLEEHLLKVIEGVEEVTTAHVREAVSKSLYSLDLSEVRLEQIQEWGDLYARRYGNPDARIKVLHKDGSEENLDYKFFQNILIPHLIERIFDTPYEAVKDSILSRKNVERMSAELLSHIKSLNTYAIRYSTLINLAHDLAVQPPHPWFVEKAFTNKTVQYNLERAKCYRESMIAHFEGGDFSSARHSSYECLHHSCSAVLAFYGTFLGCSYLGALFNLIHSLKIYKENRGLVFEGFSNFNQFEGDLKAVGMSLTDFFRLLNKTAKHINCKDKDLDHLINNVNRIFTILLSLISSRTSLIEKIHFQQNMGTVRSIEEFKDIVKDILNRSLKFRLITEDGKSHLWIAHNIESLVFRQIKPKILVVFVYKRESGFIEQDFEALTLIQGLSSTCYENFCNTIVFVANAEYQQEAKMFARKSLNQKNKFFLTLNDIINIHNSSNWIEKLEDILLNN